MTSTHRGVRGLLYLFENYSLDPGRRELRRGGTLLAIEPKVFDLLVHLISNRDQVVSKDDLIRAVWNGRIVSESSMTTCINAARTALGDNGETQRLIKTLPRKGVRFIGEVRESSGIVDSSSAPHEPAGPSGQPIIKTSLAVLPFIGMGHDPEQEYFSDGMVEEITMALSRVPRLIVIARDSSFTYKGRTVDIQQVGRELDVQYVLTGSVRRAGSRVRISGQLIDAATRAQIWADHFEGSFDDIFGLQDQVTGGVVGAVVPRLEDAEIQRSHRKITGNLNAYDYYLRSLGAFHRGTKETNDEALRLAKRAIELDSEFAPAYGLAALCYTQRKLRGWTRISSHDVAETTRFALRSAALGNHDPVALGFAGVSLVFVSHDLEAGAAMIDRALELNPNLTNVLHWSAWVKIWLGDPEGSIEHVMRAMRLSPLDPFMPLMQAAVAHGHFFASRHAEAVMWAAKALSLQPEHYAALRVSAASNAFSGNTVQALNAVERLQCVDPKLRVSNLRDVLGPHRRPDYLAKYEEGLRRAGLPE